MTITLLDAILIGIMLISALLAMVRGFSREVLSVVSWVAAAAAAYLFYAPLTPYVQPYIHNEKVAMAAAALAIFVVTLIVVSFITLRIADFIIDSRVGALDRTLGFIFGAARGLLLVVVAMLFFNWLAPQNQPAWIAQSRSKPLLDDLGQKLVAALPDNPEEAILDRFREPGSETASPPAETGDAPAASAPSSIEDAIQGSEDPDEAPAD
ncbi:CvpA family protein [Mangrovibrevibacter kandeliae]|uniref:CvpA family protein n=1 Tax=Mangrovibrevibacter kandeliae TaxID=2968473 RepID=UPI0021175C67|nr:MULTISPECIES: CvpA family protein [unclassified Aurantimonas]MCQ8781360.1 CvpA family protein [Aurantimonas sp. CSK15Z-1]MCW4114142.1 CvpA family protein [Aurantimonas sp. MSK8Z-1]